MISSNISSILPSRENITRLFQISLHFTTLHTFNAKSLEIKKEPMQGLSTLYIIVSRPSFPVTRTHNGKISNYLYAMHSHRRWDSLHFIGSRMIKGTDVQCIGVEKHMRKQSIYLEKNFLQEHSSKPILKAGLPRISPSPA